MAKDEIHQGDIGTKFLVTIYDGSTIVDISSASSTKQIVFKKPSSNKLTKSATFSSDGTDGKMYYNTIVDDLDEIGTYEIQGKVVVTDGTFYTDIQTFKVHRNL
jgi:hypothetical protein|tara:strand:- start:224 stop:535 length:312 start_codon:yes stop_codon:yes gene_type:complete